LIFDMKDTFVVRGNPIENIKRSGSRYEMEAETRTEATTDLEDSVVDDELKDDSDQEDQDEEEVDKSCHRIFESQDDIGDNVPEADKNHGRQDLIECVEVQIGEASQGAMTITQHQDHNSQSHHSTRTSSPSCPQQQQQQQHNTEETKVEEDSLFSLTAAETDFTSEGINSNCEEKVDETEDTVPIGRNFSHLKFVENPIACRRSSIKPIDHQELLKHISTKRKLWKGMPVPDTARIERIIHRSNSVVTVRSAHELGMTRSVTFHEIRIREYDQTLGDHPNVTYGPAIQLDWHYEEYQPVMVDDYEDQRGKRRSMRQMGLNYYRRKDILQNQYQFSEHEMHKAAKASSKIQFQRGITKYFLPVSKVEEAFTSVGRKTKKIFKLPRGINCRGSIQRHMSI